MREALNSNIRSRQWRDRALSWEDRALKAEALVQRMLTDPPAQMSTPLGLLPVNDEGMRTLADAYADLIRKQRMEIAVERAEAYRAGWQEGSEANENHR